MQDCKRQQLASSCPSVCLCAWNNSLPTGRIFMKFYICAFFSKFCREIKVLLKSEKNNACFTWRRFHILDNISPISLRIKNVSNNYCRENQGTYFTFNKFFLENRTVYEIMSKHVVESGGLQTIWRLHVIRAYTRPRPCIHTHTRARSHTQTHTHTHKYIILIAFPRQQWFRERVSLLRYIYIACLVMYVLGLCCGLVLHNIHKSSTVLIWLQNDPVLEASSCWDISETPCRLSNP